MGEEVDGRSDLFSLGVILYSMITGYKPFQGNSATTVCFKVANREPVPATALDSELPPEVDAVLSRAMAKDPAQRYQRGMEFALDIHGLRQLRSSQTQTSTWLPSVTATTTGATHSTSTQRSHGRSKAVKRPRAIAAIHQVYALLRNKFHRTGPKFVFSLAIPKLVLGLAILIVGLDVLSLIRRTPFAQTNGHISAIISATSTASRSATATPVYASPAPVPPERARLADNPAATAKKGPRIGASFAANEQHNRDKTTSGRAAGPTSNLKLSIEHHFSDAKVSLFIDGKLLYSHILRGQSKKRLVLFGGGIQGYDTGVVRVPAGEHRLRVHVESAQEGFDRSTTILGAFTPGQEHTLRINFERQRKNMLVDLE